MSMQPLAHEKAASPMTPNTPGSVENLVKDYALEVGFDLVGIASADPFDDDRRVTLQRLRDGLMDGLPWFNEARVERGARPPMAATRRSQHHLSGAELSPPLRG